VYSSYLIDHLADVGRLDGQLASKRTQTLSRRPLFTAFGLAAFIAAVGIALAFSGLGTALLLLCFPLAVALYGTSLFGTVTCEFLPYQRLKDIPGIKAFYTAFFWGLLTLYASRFVEAQDLHQTAFFFVYMVLSTVVDTVFCDFKDLARDRAEGVKTLPLLLGVARTSRLLQTVNGIAFLVLAVSVHLNWIPAWMLALSPIHLYVRAIIDHGQKLVDKGGNPGDAAMDVALVLWLPFALGGLALGL
jgi:4-hydroxybenzoate polyprenyltransferase